MIILLLVAMVGMASAALTLTKSPATQTVPFGGTAVFEIAVVNTGPEDLSSVTFFDDAAPDCARSDSRVLPAGFKLYYTCSLSPIINNLQNNAQAAGYTVEAVPKYVQSNVATAIVLVGPPPTYTYSIDIEKLPVTQQVYFGDTATFRINVENTGTGALTNVRVFDSAAPNCAKILGNMAPGATESYTCDMPNVVRNIQNVATVQGTKPTGGTVEDTDSAIVYMVPCTSTIGVSINPEQQSVLYDGTAKWTVIVANLGTCSLRDVKVSEANTAVVVPQGCGKAIGTMARETSQTYDCQVEHVTAPFAKTLLAQGMDPYGQTVQGTDTGTVDVIPCNLAISLSGTPASCIIHKGGTCSWSVKVENKGDVALSGVKVSGSVCGKSVGALAIGGTSTYKCSKKGISTLGLLTYPIKATGTACGQTVTATDSLSVLVKPPMHPTR
jgi:uncharacterized repeat protein (TIGR01451 family)